LTGVDARQADDADAELSSANAGELRPVTAGVLQALCDVELVTMTFRDEPTTTEVGTDDEVTAMLFVLALSHSAYRIN